MCLQLWTVNNYHWYLKQCLNFSAEKKLLGMEWDMLHRNHLHVMYEDLFYMCYDWKWITNCSQGSTKADGGFVAVIDGAKILSTSFQHGVIPPSLCGQTLQVSAPVNCIIFAPCKKVNSSCITDRADDNKINSNAVCTVLSDSSVF